MRSLAFEKMRDFPFKLPVKQRRRASPEVYLAGTGGSDPARLTFWGDGETAVSGWACLDRLLALPK